MENKKSQIGTTLTWFTAFIIIFFIIILFVSASVIIAGQKKISTIELIKYDSGSLESQRSLTSFLATPIKIDDKEEKIKDLVLESLNPYLETKDLIKDSGDLNNLVSIKQNLGKEFFEANSVELKDDILFKKSQEILSSFCSEYMLRIPQGIILSGTNNFLSDLELENSEWEAVLISDWTPWAEIQLPYKDKMVKIKFRELKKC